MQRHATWALLLAAVGCGHSEPFPPAGDGAQVPFDPSSPVRLTFSPADDRAPAWWPDGSGLLYVFRSADYPDGDRCLGILPPQGGARRLEKCISGDVAHDSVNAFEVAAIDAGGSLAWVEQVGLRGTTSVLRGSIRSGTLRSTDRGTVVQTLPYVAPDGRAHATATHLHWLHPGTLVYVGADIALTSSCPVCKLDTLMLARDIMTLDHSAPPAIVPGTSTATSVWPSADGTTVYYTLGGDSRVLQQVLNTGAVSPLFDFGALGIARDVVVRDSTLVAIVGGAVTWAPEPTLQSQEFVQRDGGGVLFHVNLNSGVVTPLSTLPFLVRHPALAPDGRWIAAEVRTPAPTMPTDLYLFEVP
jgi:hypothetical protein